MSLTHPLKDFYAGRPQSTSRHASLRYLPGWVSVVIPHYNMNDWLPGAIESVKAQTYPDVELIVVDDGSENPPMQAEVKLLENRGRGAAFDVGIMHAMGEFIQPMGADDELTPDYLSLMVARARETEADVVTPTLERFGQGSGLTTPQLEMARSDFSWGTPAYAMSMTRMYAYLSVGGFDPAFTWGEDFDVHVRLAWRGFKFVGSDKAIYRYRENGLPKEWAEPGAMDDLRKRIYAKFGPDQDWSQGAEL